MRELKDSDFKLLERLVSLTQGEVFSSLAQYLKSKYENVIITKHYIVAVGEIPIALVAHMDTVFKTPVVDLYYDRQKNVLWSPQGLGADDRAGVFAIVKILQAGHRPSVILTTDEERGGLGACALAKAGPCPIPNLKYMIELDRRGINDCVFYDCYCPSFVKYVEGFGFYEKYGSFSDISFLMDEWKTCGVNLSIGYEDEHSYSETLHVGPMMSTINKVIKMLKEVDIPTFEFNSLSSLPSDWWTDNEIYGALCSKCHHIYSEYELFPVKGLDGKRKFYCPDCIVGNVDWCNICQEAYEIADPTTNKQICKECAEEICAKTSKNNSKQ